MPAEPTTTIVPLDPATLAEFRRQGGAIVAQERGFTTACRIKLARLASSLGVPEDQIDVAIRGLHEAEPQAPPNPQEEKFRKRLRKDLAGKTRTIIGPRIEAEIIAAAARKYGLDDRAARQVLSEVAAELGLTRITASDAIDGLAAQIEQTIGDSTWLAREGWDRLRTGGAKWGIELEAVDELIDEKLAANKTEVFRRRFWTRTTLGAAGGGAALVAGVILVLLAVRANQTPPPTTEPGGAATTTTPAIATAAPPAWWDVDLSVEMAAADSRLDGLAGVCKLMKSASADERASGYEKLIDAVKRGGGKDELLETAGGIIAGCHALEPDESAAARLRTALLALLPTIDAPLPTQPEQYDVCYWAADTAAAALRRAGASDDRRRSLADALTAALSAPFDPAGELPALRRAARNRTTFLAYQQLAAAAAKEPAAVALLHRHLSNRSVAILSDEELTKAETNLLAAALPAAGKDWHAYEEAIARCASSSDSLNILRLADTLQRCTDEELVESLSRLLALRAGVRPESWAKTDVVKAVRQALGATSPAAASSAADRWLALRERADPALAKTDRAAPNQHEMLSQTVELAHLTTLALALAQGEAGFASFDAGMTAPLELSKPGAKSADDEPGRSPATPPSRTARPLGASDRRDLERFSTMLGGYARLQPAQRVNALRGLALVGDAARDVSLAQAEYAAQYLLAEKADDEHAEVLRILVAIRHWKRLRLAVADLLPQSKLTAEQQHHLAMAFLGRDIPIESASNDHFRRLLLDAVVIELSESAAQTGSRSVDPHLVFDSTAELLAETYRQRAKLFSVGGPELHATNSPAQALELSLRPLAESLRGSGDDAAYLANLGPIHQAAKFLAGDDLRQTVAMQRLLVELSTRRVIRQRPQHAAAARQIETESLAAISKSASVLHQLRDQEATLLRLWMLYAPEI